MRFIAALLIALFMAAPAAAAVDNASAADKDIQAVESYLNSIYTLKARFIQTTGDGKQVGGDFLMRRPGRMRFQYDPPIKDFIVADGTFVHYYDGAMKQGSRTLISRSLADFFLRERLTLQGDLKVQDVRRDGKMLLVKLVEAKDASGGSMTLGFIEKPALELKKWRITDERGSITEVELFDTKTGLKLDRDLFHYYDPELTKPKYN